MRIEGGLFARLEELVTVERLVVTHSLTTATTKTIYKLVFVGFSFMSHKPKTTTATRAPLAPNRADCSERREGRPTSGRPPVIFVPNTLLRFKCV